tara:strand:+ start:1136 stop:1855 length:720 start_codon:yes stop_codon:yes gene_type:complete
MSLDFTSSGSRVNHGTGATINNLPSAPMTGWVWLYRTANGTNQHVITKDDNGNFQQGWGFVVSNDGAEGQVSAFFLTSSGESNARSGSGTSFGTGRVDLNTWTFVSFVLDKGSTPNVKLYMGTQSATVAEVTAYAIQTSTATAYGDDSAYSLYVGNLQRASAVYPFKGSLARGGLINRALTVGELRTLQFASARQANVADTKLLFNYDGTTGTQPDLSGNSNSGTVTTAVRGTPSLIRP